MNNELEIISIIASSNRTGGDYNLLILQITILFSIVLYCELSMTSVDSSTYRSECITYVLISAVLQL